MVDRIWLDVPYSEKDQAKTAGARWDPTAKRWYAPRKGMTALEPWTAASDVPDLLPGEDRTLGQGLFVDLVPSSCWFTNVRSCVTPRDWERLRRMITRRAGMRCEACGAGEDRTVQRWLEAHERWVYEDVARVQGLKRLICLCTDCHTVTHNGYAQVRGLEAKAFAHLVKVTGMSRAEARRHIDMAFTVWDVRSATTWTLDLSILTDPGITLKRPPSAAERPGVATTTLAAERGAPPPARARVDTGEIVARIAVERGIALPEAAPASPQPAPTTPSQPAVPGPRDEDSASFLQRLFRRAKGQPPQPEARAALLTFPRAEGAGARTVLTIRAICGVVSLGGRLSHARRNGFTDGCNGLAAKSTNSMAAFHGSALNTIWEAMRRHAVRTRGS
ncbi:DUF5710 domain-containing protein [Streptomyces sp. 2RAF24]|uniref:DUF5710 domain-containing protein n=1 Tax=Streptomyces sp. 2RAF24 TaxID=3232997 RepID=UPI003F96ECC1